MQLRRLGSSGLTVSVVGLGCNNLGRPGTATESQAGTDAVVHAALDAGITLFDVADTYAVLFNVDASRPFLAAVDKADGLRIAYIVTDDETQYQAVAGQLPDGVESVRLYESYLRTFQINTGRA